jgi:hypothetical protein
MAQDDLNVISYVDSSQEKPLSDPKEKPISFIITQFHIIFVYPRNFTVLSSITQ